MGGKRKEKTTTEGVLSPSKSRYRYIVRIVSNSVILPTQLTSGDFMVRLDSGLYHFAYTAYTALVKSN